MTQPSNDSDVRKLIPQSVERVALGAAALSVVLIAVLSYRDAASFTRLSEQLNISQRIVTSTGDLVASLTDAETGQRGFLLTGRDSYLEPYNRAVSDVPGIFTGLADLTAKRQDQAARVEIVKRLAQQKLDELQTTINLRRSRGSDAALDEVLSDRGKVVMDQIRHVSAEIESVAHARLAQQAAAAQSAAYRTRIVIVAGSVLIFGFLISATVTVHQGTQRRHALIETLRNRERALSDSQQLLDALVRNSPAAIYIKTLTGHYALVNRRFEELPHLTLAQAQITGKTDYDLFTKERADAFRAGDQQVAASGKAVEKEASLQVGNGLRTYLSVKFPISSANGETYAIAGILTDITERKRVNERLQAQVERLALLDHITRAVGERQDLRSIFQVVIRSLEDSLPIAFGCICLYDPLAASLTVTCVGVRSEALAMQLAMAEQARIPIDRNGLGRCVQGQLVYEPDLRQVDFPFPRRLLEAGLASVVMAPLLSERKVFGILVATRREAGGFSSGDCEFLRQLSDHVALAAHQAELYASLQHAYDDLRQTQQAVIQQERLRALGQMASGIAHDINNALSPVALYTESLLERRVDLSPSIREHLETTQRALDDVAHTVARLHEFYRQREPQLMLLPVDLNLMVQQVLTLTRARWSDMPQQRGIVIEVRTDLAWDLPRVPGIESEIREALVNLVFNAVDAMPDGGTLTLRTTTVADGPRTDALPLVAIEVSDTGQGMDEETRRRCLEPFFSTKGERGTGLGLAMVFGMAQRHQAEINIESAPGLGSTMCLAFPIRNAGAPESTPADAPAPSRQLRILVVDDDPMILKSLRDTLERDGHMVTTATGGKEGIDAFGATPNDAPFAVVITDLGMPRVDGRQVARAVKSMQSSTTVILLTGWGQRLVAEGDVPETVDRVLAKPPKLRELRAVLTELASGKA